MPTRPVPGGPVAERLIDLDEPDCWRYVLPTPDRQLALLAEFTTPDGADDEVRGRIEALMASFHWAN